MLDSGKFQGSVQSWSLGELNESDSFWFSIRSHEHLKVENVSAWFEQGSNVWIVGVEWKSLDADFEFSFFIVFSFLDWSFYLLNDDNLIFWGFSDWNNFGWFLLFRFWFHLYDFLGSLNNWLNLFARWLFTFLYWFLLGGNWLLEGRFSDDSLFDNLLWSLFFRLFRRRLDWLFLLLNSLLNWGLSGLLKWGFGDDGFFGWLHFLFTFLFRWFLNLLGDWLGGSLDWGNDFLWSLDLLLFGALFTLFLDFLLGNDGFLNWGFSNDSFLGWLDFFLTFFRWSFGLFNSFLWSSILCFDGLDWLFLNLWGLLIHGSLWGLSGRLCSLGFSDGGFFFFTRLLDWSFLFGLFLGVDLLFLRDD